MMGDYYGGGYGLHEFLGGFGGFFMILFWGLIIWAVIVFVKSMSNNNKSAGGPREDTAVLTLRERYAKGELTKEQFDQMKKDLTA